MHVLVRVLGNVMATAESNGIARHHIFWLPWSLSPSNLVASLVDQSAHMLCKATATAEGIAAADTTSSK